MEIVVINIFLSGDNALVNVLACRNLPKKEAKLGIFYGVIGVVVLRVMLTFFAVTLLGLPSPACSSGDPAQGLGADVAMSTMPGGALPVLCDWDQVLPFYGTGPTFWGSGVAGGERCGRGASKMLF